MDNGLLPRLYFKCLNTSGFRGMLAIACYVMTVVVMAGCAYDRDKNENTGTLLLENDDQMAAAVGALYLNPSDMRNSRAIWYYLTMQHRFGELVGLAEPFFLALDERGRESERGTAVCACVYLAQSYLFMEDFEKADFYLDKIRNSPLEFVTERIAIIAHNTEAILALKAGKDYSKAMYHLKAALSIAQGLNDELNSCSTLCNMAAVYYERRDTSGLQYAKMAYEIAENRGDSNAQMYGALLMAQMSIVAGDYETAHFYADKAGELITPDANRAYFSLLWLIHGDIYQMTGRYRQADSVYNRLMENRDEVEPGLLLEFYYKYGSLKLKEGHYFLAEEYFKKGLRLSYEKNNIKDRHNLLLGLSDVYDRTGNTSMALDYYKKHHYLLDSISLVQKERDFLQLLMNYDKMIYEDELQIREAETQRSRHRNTIAVFIILIITVISAGIWFLYRRKNMMCRKLVEQHQLYVGRIRQLESETRRRQDRSDISLSEKKATEIYDEIEKLMSEQKVYRNNDISLERLARILDTNRSYISEIINRYAKVSFTTYINMKRIEEAIARLSDLADETPLKAMCSELGFNSTSAFYRTFQKETGCSPSRYREEVRHIKSS